MPWEAPTSAAQWTYTVSVGTQGTLEAGSGWCVTESIARLITQCTVYMLCLQHLLVPLLFRTLTHPYEVPSHSAVTSYHGLGRLTSRNQEPV